MPFALFPRSARTGRFGVFSVVLFAALGAAPGSAQPVVGRAEAMSASTNAGAAYYYVRPGTASVRVQVLGAVRSPGLYEVSEGTALGQVLALAGGPALGTTPAETRTDVSVRLYRPGPGGQEVAFDGPLERAIDGATAPPLRDGDVLLTEVWSRRAFGWREIVQVVSTVSVLALAVERLLQTGN